MPLALTLLTSATIAAASPTPAAAPAATGGISAQQSGARLTVTFSRATLAVDHLERARIHAECSKAPAPTAPLLRDDDEPPIAIGSAVVGRDGVARITLSAGEAPLVVYDSCDIGQSTDEDIDELAQAALTPAGAVWLEEVAIAAAMHQALRRARGPLGYRPAAQVPGVVALDGPDATPPAGLRGYWADGAHAVVVAVSSAGRRLLVEDLGDGMLRTNVYRQTDLTSDVFDEDLGGSAASAARHALATGAVVRRRAGEDELAPAIARLAPVTARDGVRARLDRGRLTLRFTGRSARRFRALAGHRLTVMCIVRPAPSAYPGTVLGLRPSAGSARVPAHGGRVAVHLRSDRGGAVAADTCIAIHGETAVATADVTDAGRRWWADLRALDQLDATHLLAAGGATYRTTEDVAAGAKGAVLAMRGPDGPAPINHPGYWSDGARYAAVATRSTSGRQFFVVDEGDGMMRTNVLGELTGMVFFDLVGVSDPGAAAS